MDFNGLTVWALVCWGVDGEICRQGLVHVPGVLQVPMCFYQESLHKPSTSLGIPEVPCDVSLASNQECQQPHVQPPLQLLLLVGVVVCIHQAVEGQRMQVQQHQ